MPDAGAAPACDRCGKPAAVCICDVLTPVVSGHRVTILQHPQEQDVLLGTAPLVVAALAQARVSVGLSWRNLSEAVGEAACPGAWAAVYPGALSPLQRAAAGDAPAVLVTRRGIRLPLRGAGLRGILVLDGTWSQAKALWWRNAWLLKCPRLVLRPVQPTIYGRLRRAPHRHCVATLEAVAGALDALGDDPNTGLALRRSFRVLVQRVRDQVPEGAGQ